MTTRKESQTPAWAMGVLFWRKVEMLVRRGIPVVRAVPDPVSGGPRR
ncbi:MAG TPA: hypothetical protein VJX92_00810 [Methylomirabilota bacterium]|nr:hypothetical protein [Methylomirabilota bacterium]